ncbi:phosphoribosyltransferase family protein [Streptomyces sp. NPDC101221]|uniref:phosphoribosyltransferase family protein n=1 Tax=Streptomyces sp. NPDC101221 TaxID=3366132 RepID=UPI003801645F
MLCRGDPATPHAENRTVVVVDDGLATGATARDALRRLRRARPARLILAAPSALPGPPPGRARKRTPTSASGSRRTFARPASGTTTSTRSATTESPRS